VAAHTLRLKASVEYEGPDRPARLGAVVTNCGFSDWSTVDFPAGVTELHLRVRREGSDYIVEASLPAAHAAATNAIAAAPPLEQAGDAAKHAVARAGWTQLRVAHLIEDAAPWGVAAAQEGARGAVSAPVDVGVYACSPRGQGFWACFKHLMLVKACAADA
jgi:regulation of enolase protein 1 (concanavalin A-like superfamily)